MAKSCIQFCILDDRLGQEEGRELERVLAFYPASTSSAEQIAVTGLVLALMAFSRTFDDEVQSRAYMSNTLAHPFAFICCLRPAGVCRLSEHACSSASVGGTLPRGAHLDAAGESLCLPAQCVLGSLALCLAICRTTLTTVVACRQLEQMLCAS